MADRCTHAGRTTVPPRPAAIGFPDVALVAIIGVGINIVSALMFARGRGRDVNMRAAFVHLMADAAVGVGVAIAGVLVMWTGKVWIDPIASLVVTVVILLGTVRLLRETFNLALAGVPAHIDLEKVQAYLAAHPTVRGPRSARVADEHDGGRAHGASTRAVAIRIASVPRLALPRSRARVRHPSRHGAARGPRRGWVHAGARVRCVTRRCSRDPIGLASQHVRGVVHAAQVGDAGSTYRRKPGPVTSTARRARPSDQFTWPRSRLPARGASRSLIPRRPDVLDRVVRHRVRRDLRRGAA